MPLNVCTACSATATFSFIFMRPRSFTLSRRGIDENANLVELIQTLSARRLDLGLSFSSPAKRTLRLNDNRIHFGTAAFNRLSFAHSFVRIALSLCLTDQAQKVQKSFLLSLSLPHSLCCSLRALSGWRLLTPFFLLRTTHRSPLAQEVCDALFSGVSGANLKATACLRACGFFLHPPRECHMRLEVSVFRPKGISTFG